MDSVLYFKNFSMGTELEVAGNFIYRGVKTFDTMKNFKYEAEIFSFLYFVSVGIERLQKILIVLSEEINLGNMKEFESELITHSHQELQRMIKNKVNIELTPVENEFLQLITNFYSKYRYSRFCLNGKYSEEQEALTRFLESRLNITIQINDVFNTTNNNSLTKKFIGKTVGNISKKYYKAIVAKARELNIYTYELECDSAAFKIFKGEFDKNDFIECMNMENIAMKELLICLINIKKEDPYLDFLKSIEPLEVDVAMLQEYTSELCCGNVSQTLMDEIEFLYNEIGCLEEKKNRLQLMDVIDNTNIIWDYPDDEQE